MIHIVFQEADVEVLQQAINLDNSLTGDIMEVKDDFAVGPIVDIYSGEGIERRKNWWRQVLAGSDIDGKVDDGSVNDVDTVRQLIRRLTDDPAEVVWIWAAQNKHDVSGYYWLMSQLKDYQGRIFILYLNNLPFFNDKGNIFYPEDLHAIPPKEFLKARKLARPITSSEFEIDPDEWKKWCAEDKSVRILEGGKKLGQFDADFYDADLKKFILPDWQKASRIISQFLHKASHRTGDMYLLWRLKVLLQDEGFAMQGEMKGMKDFEIRRKPVQADTSA